MREGLLVAAEVVKYDPIDQRLYLANARDIRLDVIDDVTLKLKPKNPEVLTNLGTIKRQRGDLAGAIVNLEAAVKLIESIPGRDRRQAATSGWRSVHRSMWS